MSFPIDRQVPEIVPTTDGELAAKLRGKYALVVGGTKGIGQGVALELAAAGAHVTMVGRTNGDFLLHDMRLKLAKRNASSSLPPPPPKQRLEVERADLSTAAGCEALVEALTLQSRQFDLVVFTVGAWPHWDSPFSEDGVEKVVALDLRARHMVLVGLAEKRALAPGVRVMNTLASTQRFFLDAEYVKRRLEQARSQPPSSLYNGLMPMAVAADAWLLVAADKLKSWGVQIDAFVGMFPGLVITDLPAKTFPPWVTRLMHMAMGPVSITAEECGRAHLDILVAPSLGRHVIFANYMLEARRTHPLAYDRTLGEFVWEYLERDCHAPPAE